MLLCMQATISVIRAFTAWMEVLIGTSAGHFPVTFEAHRLYIQKQSFSQKFEVFALMPNTAIVVVLRTRE